MSQSQAALAATFPGAQSETSTRGGIIGTGSCLPDRVVTNKDLEGIVNTSDEWITERVGIKERRIARWDQSTVDLAEVAAKNAMERAGLTFDEVDLIVFATVTPEKHLPSAAALLQSRLGASKSMAFDIHAACSGFLFALSTASGLQAVNGYRNALVVGAETLSKIVDWTDRDTCVLFADGAGAVIYQRPDSVSQGAAADASSGRSGIIASDFHTIGSHSDLIARPGFAFPAFTFPEEELHGEKPAEARDQHESPYVRMKGREVFKAAITTMSESVEVVLEKAGVTIDEVSLFVPHQSNRRIIDGVCKKVGMKNPDTLYTNIERVGNASAASIPIALDHAVNEGRVSTGDLVLMTAVGAGLTYGSILLRL